MKRQSVDWIEAAGLSLGRALGWHGVTIDATKEFASSCAESRRKSRFFAAFVAETNQVEATPHENREHAAVVLSDPFIKPETAGDLQRTAPK